MPGDANPRGRSTAARVGVGVLAGLTLVAIGLLVFPSLVFSGGPSTGEGIVATDGAAKVLAGELRFSMSDQEITDTVSGEGGARVVELRRGGNTTTVLVSIPDSINEPTTHACYRFTLRNHEDVAYEKATGCSVPPSS